MLKSANLWLKLVALSLLVVGLVFLSSNRKAYADTCDSDFSACYAGCDTDDPDSSCYVACQDEYVDCLNGTIPHPPHHPYQP